MGTEYITPYPLFRRKVWGMINLEVMMFSKPFQKIKNKAKSIGNQSGFTLIEVAITMAVVLLALIGAIAANTRLHQTGSAAYERSVAIQDANQIIERIRNTASSGQFPGNVTTAFPNNGQVAGFSGLTNEQIIVSYVNTSADPLDVSVTVNWHENGVRNVSQTLRTLVTQRT